MSMRQQPYNKQNPKLVQKEVTTQPPTMSKFGSNWPSCFRVEDRLYTFPKGPMLNYVQQWWPSWNEGIPPAIDPVVLEEKIEM